MDDIATSQTDMAAADAAPSVDMSRPKPADSTPGPNAWQIIRFQRLANRGAVLIVGIAGFSLLNIVVSSSGWGMAFGLAITDVIAAFIPHLAGAAQLAAWALALGVAAIFVALGALAYANRRWAYLTAMIVYSLDALIFVYFQDWFGVIFHLGALAYMFNGYQSLMKLQPTRSKTKASGPVVAPAGE